ncbi:hypothetical protein [Streptomyces sp. VRA16 Mangrove soil]|uniref:hypothetical protein n=1 Tax=Streptomyces sp. VRA16 Mangrove soil TaxID=2817434 RepID=UPI001A9E1933|nr:hypothetical protein [Streptomyces sp. VRA16 Mangrove soil]MBO1333228.1 hypothetical protein [Streptomyces sp. VRA16 Mangrove soil]
MGEDVQRRTRLTTRTAAALAGLSALVTLTACGSGDGGSGKGGDDPFAGKSADRIAADAVKATKDADSLHMKGTVRQSGSTVTVDLSVDQDKNCDGTIATDGAHADIRHTNGTLYLRGDEQYWRAALKEQPGADKIVPKVKDKWVKAPADDATTAGLCDKQGLVASMDENKSERTGMKKGPATTVDGTKAIKLTKKKSSGETLALYVAAEGKPYILRSTSTGGKAPNTATFSDYGKAVRPQTPPADETVDLKKIAGGGDQQA